MLVFFLPFELFSLVFVEECLRGKNRIMGTPFEVEVVKRKGKGEVGSGGVQAFQMKGVALLIFYKRKGFGANGERVRERCFNFFFSFFFVRREKYIKRLKKEKYVYKV